jgi:anti-sigma factor RsiW
MNAHFDSPDSSMEPLHNNTTNTHDRFELLSAYLDGEVTAEERRLVELWLEQDPKIQNMHRRLMMMRQGFKSAPVPTPVQPVEQTIEKVFEKVDRRSRFRVIAGGVTAAAAAVVATVVGVSQLNQPLPQMAAKSPTAPITNEAPTTEGLLVSLDEPVLVVSKTAVVNQPSGNKNVGTKDTMNWQNSQ